MAIVKALLDCDGNYDNLKEFAINSMVKIGRNHSQCGFGGNFFKWLIKDDYTPYNSFGNGATMRVSACGIVTSSLDEVKYISKIVMEISHNHPEAVKAAQCVASCVYLAKIGKSKDEIKKFVKENYYYINFCLDDIRTEYEVNVTCQGSIPEALQAFFESKSYEDTIRKAISIGGDSDTRYCRSILWYSKKIYNKVNDFF